MKSLICGLLAATAFSLFNAGASAQVATDVVCSNCVDTTDIAVGAVNSARIANGEVKAVDISPNAVTSAHIMDGQVKAQDLATDAVTTGRIKNGEVKAADIDFDAVRSAHILDGQVKTQDLADEAVTNSKLGFESITTDKLNDHAITAPKIADGAVTAAKLGLANTIFVEDSGDDTANCTALRDALNGLTGPAAVVLGPGTFDCGSNAVVIPANVSLIGAGQNLTNITGNVTSVQGFIQLIGDDILLAQISIDNDVANAGTYSIAVRVGPFDADSRRWHLRDVSITATNGTDFSTGVIVADIDCDGGKLTNVDATASGSTGQIEGILISCPSGSVTGTNLRGVASGTAFSYALHQGSDNTLTIRNSAFTGPTAVRRSGGTLKVISSELDGVVDGSVICVGNYDDSGAALSAGTNGSGGCV